MSAISALAVARAGTVETQVAVRVTKLARDVQKQTAQQLIKGIEQVADRAQEAGKGQQVDLLA